MITRKNLPQHELIGLPVSCRGGACGRGGLSGTVMEETKNTFLIDTGKGERTIPKKGCAFLFSVGKRKYAVDGGMICVRPHERPKKLSRKQIE